MIQELEPTATDLHFGRFIRRQAGDGPDWLELIASLTGAAVAGGSICLNLADLADATIRVEGRDQRLPGLPELRAGLKKSEVVGAPGEYRPLVLDRNDRLYLYRYWKYEQELARIIQEKSAPPPERIDEALLGAGVRRLFPAPAGAAPDWQKIAALGALRKRFFVISGGPGTGKTSTVVKILTLLVEQAGEEPLRIALAAPTGKAAARLAESIRLMKQGLACDQRVKERIPEEVGTIHRLLGVRSGSTRFRHGTDNPLPHQVVIVDEASMVALPLMAKLALALEPHARLILLGDKDQLASVEAGAALGDICGGGHQELFSPAFQAFVARVGSGPLTATAPDGQGFPRDSLTVLKENYRFAADSGIGGLARAVNAGDAETALGLFKDDTRQDIRRRDLPTPERLAMDLAERVIDGYAACLATGNAEEALRLFDGFRVLTPLRRGPYGVEELNRLIEEILVKQGLIRGRGRWYAGRPVMITVNDYNLRLFNGDIGIVRPDPDAGGGPAVFFPSPEGGLRRVSPLRLPDHETVFAMTIHKSQGSEFNRILMLLPDQDRELMTRELIYTGLTRARSTAEVWGNEAPFRSAVARRILRGSGLRELLWGD